jgi:hypothetical protein
VCCHREIHIRTRITLVWDDEAGEVLVLQVRTLQGCDRVLRALRAL